MALWTSSLPLLTPRCAYRSLVVIVGNERALKLAVSDTKQKERYGALRERLREALG